MALQRGCLLSVFSASMSMMVICMETLLEEVMMLVIRIPFEAEKDTMTEANI
jgi:hypothetical protein